jgi:glycerate kinase
MFTVVIAPDSFKGSFTAVQVAQALVQGTRRVAPQADIVLLPVADGGEGTVAAFLAAGGSRYEVEVTGPLGSRVTAFYGVLKDGRAVIEMAAASGLPLVPPERRNPLVTTSRGTGELIKAALDRGCRRILLGIGGSATNDAGLGMAQALGWSFTDALGKELGAGGGALGDLAVIDARHGDPRLAQCEIVVASDVTNPLVGEHGASVVYGPQKGATPSMVAALDSNLRHFADCVARDVGPQLHEVAGGGAAGGLGAGLIAFCGARLESGIGTVLDAVGFDAVVRGADLVLTGEGRLDGQSLYGKVPVGVALRAKAVNPGVTVVAVVGSLGPGASAVYQHGIDALVPLADGPMTLEESMARVGELLEQAAERVVRLYLSGAGELKSRTVAASTGPQRS